MVSWSWLVLVIYSGLTFWLDVLLLCPGPGDLLVLDLGLFLLLPLLDLAINFAVTASYCSEARSRRAFSL